MAVTVTTSYLYENGYLDTNYGPILLKLSRDNPNRLPSELILKNDIMTRAQLKKAYGALSILSTSVEEFQPLLIEDYLEDAAYRLSIERALESIIENQMFPLYFREGSELVFAVREGSDVVSNTQILNEIVQFFKSKACSVSTFLASDFDEYLEKFLLENSLRVDRPDPYQRDVARLPEVYILRSILLGATDIYFDAIKAGYRYKYKILNEQFIANDIILDEEERSIFLRAIYMLEGEIPERMLGEITGDHFINNLGNMEIYSGRCQHSRQVRGMGVNIRVMDLTKTSRPLDDCGLSPNTLERVKVGLHYRSGEIVIAGPTGSGKSTFMASFNDALVEEHPTMRLEEAGKPIEQENENRSQIPIRDGLDYDGFTDISTRRNADIIVTSEANTAESAEGFIKCASEDKLAITTTHTPSAAFITERFRQFTTSHPLYFDDFIMNLKMCTHQLMLKECCPKCTQKIKLNNTHFSNPQVKMLKHYGFTSTDLIPVAIPKENCPVCEGRGYLVRKPVIIMEVLNVTDKLRRKMRALDDPSKMIELIEDTLFQENATELHDAFYWMGKGRLSFDYIWEKCDLVSKIDDFVEDTDITVTPDEVLKLRETKQ